jgi:mono/diheme cytochrome c family protein
MATAARKTITLAIRASFFQRLHAARCVACHGVRSHPVPVALVGECSIPVV